MKNFILVIILSPFLGFSQTTNLFISEYGEGLGGSKKYIEIYNGTGIDVDLNNYQLLKSTNGAAYNATPILLTGILANNDVFVIANNATDVPNADVYNTTISHNGDDGYALTWNGGSGTIFNIIDVFGLADGIDPGTSWNVAGNVNATVDKILVRKSSVCSPNTDWLSIAGTDASNSEYEIVVDPYNTVGQESPYLGSHISNCTGACNLSTSGLVNVTCNNNNTATDPTDDYVTFELNPTGSNLGATYTVSVASGAISPTSASYGNSTLFQLQSGSAGSGNVIVTITDDATGGCTFDATITDPGSCSSSTPIISANPTNLTGLDHNVGTPSTEQTFTVSGLALIDDIILTAPADVEISLTTGAGFTNSLVLNQIGGDVPTTTIYVRGNAAMMGNFSGDIIANSTNAAEVAVNVSGFADDYVYYTIDQISTVNANGVSDSLDVLVEVTGVVHCMDFDGNAGYSITLIDASEEGINLYSTVDISNYTSPMEGDSIRVYGKIGQYNGLTEVIADEIELLAQNVALFDPVLVTALDESTESQYIMMQGMTLVTPITNFATGSSNVDITDGTNTFVMRIDSDTDIPGSAAPQGYFTVIGVGGQFDNSSPYDGGYQIFPCSVSTIIFECTTPSNSTTLVNESTASADATGLSYQWIDCATGLPIANAIQQSYTATTTGSYAVIVTDTDCSDTSDCISLTVCSNPIATTTLVNDSTATADAIGVQYQWLDCSTGLAIANENQQTFTATASGSYAVVVSEGACSDTSECVNLTLSVGIEEMLNTNSIKVYPNPIVDELSITSSSDFSILFSVADINGKVITKDNILHSSATINTSKWSKGVYFVKFSSEKGEFIVKVMK